MVQIAYARRPLARKSIFAGLTPLGPDQFEGYASLFGIADGGGDTVAPGAFAQSLRRRGPAQVRMLYQHFSHAPIGVWEEIAEDRKHPEIFAEFRKKNAKKFRGALAPEYNIRTIEAAVNLPFDEGMAEERKLFGVLMSGKQSAALLIYGEDDWSDLDLRVDDHADPLTELARIERLSREHWTVFRHFMPSSP